MATSITTSTKTTLTSKGQMTLPKSIRDRLGLKAGVQFDCVVDGKGAIIMRPRTLKAKDIYGMLATKNKHKRPLTIEEMDAGIAQAVKERHRRSRKS